MGVPETVESETTPTPTQIEESESNPITSPTEIRQGREGKPKESESNLVKSQGGEIRLKLLKAFQVFRPKLKVLSPHLMVLSGFNVTKILSKSAAAQERKYQRNPKHQKRHPRKPFA